MFVGGIVYLRWYKANVLDKVFSSRPWHFASLTLLQIELAFEAGYDPALELAKSHTSKNAVAQDLEFEGDEPWTEHLRRKEQDIIDLIIKGEEPGHYFMLLGPKVRAYRFPRIAQTFDFL